MYTKYNKTKDRWITRHTKKDDTWVKQEFDNNNNLIKPQGLVDQIAKDGNNLIIEEIKKIEIEKLPRALTDAALGDDTYLLQYKTQIDNLRSKLV